jgi:exonuclease III
LLKIISWNVRGLNDAGKRISISNFKKNWKLDVVCLQETKMDNFESGFIQSMWVGPFTGWVTLPTASTSSGILLMWDKCIVDCLYVVVGTFSLSCKFLSVLDQFVWAFSGVYGPNADPDRNFLWEELSGIIRWWDVS